MSKVFYSLNTTIIFFLFLLQLVSNESLNNFSIEETIYPSVLSLHNDGFVVIQKDGIHFYDSNKAEDDSKKIIFEKSITSKEANEKISMSQFPEKEGSYIIIIVLYKIYFFQKNGILLNEINMKEMSSVENIKVIPYKEENNYLFYFISYKNKNDSKKFFLSYYKYDLINKMNIMIETKQIESIKASFWSKSYDIFGFSCILMRNNETNEDIISCFYGAGFPAEIQAIIFSINNRLIKEKHNYKYLIGNYEIVDFNIITAIPNFEKEKAIVYYTKNNILSKINFNVKNGLYDNGIISPEVELPNQFWKEESEKYNEPKESLFSSRLFWAYCKSYLIFFNKNFTKFNSGFISHDNACASLLSYSKFFKDKNYSLTIESINMNKILIRKKRKLSLSKGKIPESCKQSEDGYSPESLNYGLCLICNSDYNYYKVLDPNNSLYDNNQGFIKCFNESNKNHFYLDTITDPLNPIYKPCYETCSSCEEGGDAFNNKCTKCALKYKLVINDQNPDIKNCEAMCPFADYYRTFLGYYECTETNSCPSEAPYLLDTPELKRCFKDCEESGFLYSYAGKCYTNCSQANAVIDSEIDKTCKDPEPTLDQRCFLSFNNIDSVDKFMTSEGVQSCALTYAKDFYDTTTHVNYYNNSNAIMVIYKDQTCIEELNLKVPSINFTECKNKIIHHYKNITSDFNENTDIITALVGGNSTSSGVETTYSFFYKNGDYINVSQICSGIKFDIKNIIDRDKVDDNAEKIAAQGIDIFDLDNPFYTDICFMYDSPTGKDATPNDRFHSYFPNVTLCDEESGCVPNGLNLTSFEIICKCDLNDIMSNPKVGEKILEDGFGEIMELIENSNIMIFKCAKDVFVIKHLLKNSGTFITIGIMLAQAICVVFYYLLSYNPMLRYLYYLSEYQCSLIEQKNLNKANKNKDSILDSKLIKVKAPPKKEEKHEINTPSNDKLISEDSKKPKKLDITGSSNSNINLNNKFIKPKLSIIEKYSLKNENKIEKKPMYADKIKEEYDIDMEEYLKTDYDDMEFEDALKEDKRTFCEYYCDRFREKQIIMDTFFNPENLKPMTIKIIILLLNIILYFVINGLFYSEEYVSDLFNSDEKETFFSFLPRSLSRFVYTTIVGVIIGIIVDFIAVDEKKVKRLFLREKKNTLQIRYEISIISTDIKRNYLILTIICFVIDLIALYYVNCFNNVYPNLQGEWIKSSICIMIIMQILTMLVGLLAALIRLIAFKLKSERVYKIIDLFE